MPTKDLHFPDSGVNRRLSLRNGAGRRERYFAPWSANVRFEDPFDRRLRGGSRPGLTKFHDDDFGTTIADIASINVSSASGGASELLFVLVDSVIKTVENGTAVTPIAYLTDEAGDILTDESDNQLVASSADPPATGFLVTGQQHVFAVTTGGVTKIDPKTGQVDDLVASAGTIPTNSTFGAVYRDRLCLSGEDNAIYMSRQGDYADWAYGQHISDQGRAIPFQLSLSADVGPKPTAIIPCLDNYLICASARTLWVVESDPGSDGALRRISETVGIVGSKAWVKVDTTIVFLSEDGLYQVRADGSELTPLTTDVIPDELRNIDVSTTTVSLGWDQDRSAFHIYLRTAAGSNTHWLYEPIPQAFWPMRYQNDHSPLAVAQHKGELLLAGSDGYIRKVTGDNDDGSNIESHVAIGPVMLSDDKHFGRLLDMHATLAAGSGAVNWRVVAGNTAEEAADNVKLAIEAFQAGGSYSGYVQASGSWSSGRALLAYPRVRAVWVCIWLQSVAKWAFEAIVIDTVPSGKWRGV